MSSHAKLSPSAAKRWLTCPGSVAFTEAMPDKTSSFAIMGTLCHTAGEICLVKGLDADELELTGELAALENEHLQIVQEYVDYVRALPGHKMIEVRMRLTDDVWGTSDAIVFGDKTLSVVDLKTGAGVKVDAQDNDQMRIYALMALEEYGFIHGPFDTVEMHIVQPPLDHISVWSVPLEELLRWKAEVLEPGIKKALSPGAPLVVSEEGCRFCRGKAICKARADANLRVAQEEFGEPCPSAERLTLEDIAGLLPRLKQISKWCSDVEEYAMEQALKGTEVPGYKLVEGRTTRKWSDETAVVNAMRSAGLSDDQIYNMKLIGMTEAEKLLGKKSEVFNLAVKSMGKPALVPVSDKRPAMAYNTTAAEDFAPVEESGDEV